MVINKRKKNMRQRGSKTHGYGSKKKHRGAGNRGGRGMAGSGKRADTKKPSVWKGKYFGKFGFKSRKKKFANAINLFFIEDNLDSLTKKNLVTKDNDFYNIDLEKLGFKKLLSAGKVTKKFKIRVLYASKNAIEKVNSAGGQIIGLREQQIKEK